MFQQIFTEDAGAHSEEGNIKEDKRLRGFFHMVDTMEKKDVRKTLEFSFLAVFKQYNHI